MLMEAIARRRRVARFSPLSLFAAGEQGILADLSDLSTLFTDTAGTTPVTAPGQTVALALDKSRGLVLGPELVTTQNLTNPAWVSGGAFGNYAGSTATVDTITSTGVSGSRRFRFACVPGQTFRASTLATRLAGSATNANIEVAFGTSGAALIGAPLAASGALVVGQTTLLTITAIAPSTAAFCEIIIRANGPSGSQASFSNISVRELTGNHLTQPVAAARPIYGRHPARGYVNQLVNSDTVVTQNVTVAGVAMTLSFTGTGTVTLSGVSTAGPLVGTGASDRVSLAFTPSAGTLTLTVSGDVRLGQLERGTLTAYQRTGAASGLAFPRPVSYDITEAGVPSLHYLFCDGLARWMVSPTITPGTDKAQVFAGVRKLSDAAIGIVAESSANAGANAGTLYLATPASLAFSGRDEFLSRGTASAVANTVNASPFTQVAAGLGDISGDRSTFRVNGVQVGQSTADQGSGNFLAYPLYIGSRGGTSLFFNGLIYSIVVRFGPNLPLATIQQVERWTAQRTGVTL